MAQRELSCLILFSLFFFSYLILSSSSSIRTSKVNSQSTEAEKFIQSLNLFPSSGVNSNALSSSLVEKQFLLPAFGDPGTPIQNLGHHAGYYRLPHSNDARMFYYFFESRMGNRDDPVVIWLNGGPGCSSSIGLFYENGPYKIHNNSLIWNDFGWDQVSNMIYVDQPTGTGFSYSSDDSDMRNNQDSVTNDLYDFLQVFFRKHPQYLNNHFYITGESYAGHYIPALASWIHNGNKNGYGTPINLKGFAIGNGLTHPEIQYKSYPDYALSKRLITESQAKKVKKLIPKCEKYTTKCNARIGGEGQSCKKAYDSCIEVFTKLMKYVGSTKNYYDTREESVGRHCYDLSYLEQLLNKRSVRYSLGVGNNIEFVSCNNIVTKAMTHEWMRNYAVLIPALLEDGIKVLIYAGEYDLFCNWLGIYRWVNEMIWSGQRWFNGASPVSYEVDNAEKGELQKYGPLTFLKVLNAGHMVPMDQPKVALKMLKRWTKGTL